MTGTRWGIGPCVAAAAAVALVAFAGAPAGASAVPRAGASAVPRAAGAGSAAAVRAVTQTPREVRDYWTPARMRAAEPAGLLVSPGSSELERAGSGSGVQPSSGVGAAEARAAADDSGASSSFPSRAHGKVFFTLTGGSQSGDYVCSGTVVTSNARSLVWTAGHCVDGSDAGAGFATNWQFVPGYRNGERPFGTWPATALLTTDRWRDQADVRLDLGAALLARDGEGRGIEDVLGARQIAFNQGREAPVSVFGYPAQANLLSVPPRIEFDGERLFRCDSPVTGDDSPPGEGPSTVQVGCDMTAGASGGGWVIDGGRVNGLTSYTYVGDGSHLYGPYFGSAARALYERASGPPLLCSASQVTNLGGAGPDDYRGTDGADVLALAAGADTASARSGDDHACGGGGADRLRGGLGRDVLRGGPGNDALDGGPGRDVCVGGPGRDRATGCESRRQVS